MKLGIFGYRYRTCSDIGRRDADSPQRRFKEGKCVRGGLQEERPLSSRNSYLGYSYLGYSYLGY